MQKTLWEKIEAQFNELKSKLTAPAAGADTSAQTKAITDFRAELDSFKTELAAKDEEITKLKAEVTKLTGEATAKDGEITKLKADAKTAGELAADAVAATGLDPAALPAANKDKKDSAKPTLRAQYLALCAKDSVAAGRFYAQHAGKDEFWKE